MQKLSREFYARDTITVAKELLGKYLVHIHNDLRYVVRIVEVEAYIGAHDLAAHSSKGITTRTKVMYGEAGHAYIYFIYGMYHCMNVVTDVEGHGSGVLLRAAEPIENISLKTNGPGLLCKAMHIDKRYYGHDLLSNDLFIAYPPEEKKFTIIKRPRINVSYAKHWARRLLRFYIKNNSYVSKK